MAAPISRLEKPVGAYQPAPKYPSGVGFAKQKNHRSIAAIFDQ